MHFDTRLLIDYFMFISSLICYFCQSSDDQSYLALIEFNRGGSLTNVILSSPHGGFLGSDNISKQERKSTSSEISIASLIPLPIGGCYNNTLDRCIYTLRDCLRTENDNGNKISFHPDARCMNDRSSTSAMYSLTRAIADAFAPAYRPFTILNKLTRQYVDPAEDLLAGTFLLESSTRVYIDYHRLIAISKEAIRPPSRGLFIEFVFHKNSQTVQLGYGFEPIRSSTTIDLSRSTITELITRTGLNVIEGNHSFGYFLHLNGFEHVIPLKRQRLVKYRLSTYSTRTHADQRFNAILFSYPIERLRTHTINREAKRIAKAIEQFVRINDIRQISASFYLSTNPIMTLLSLLLFLSRCMFNH